MRSAMPTVDPSANGNGQHPSHNGNGNGSGRATKTKTKTRRAASAARGRGEPPQRAAVDRAAQRSGQAPRVDERAEARRLLGLAAAAQ